MRLFKLLRLISTWVIVVVLVVVLWFASTNDEPMLFKVPLIHLTFWVGVGQLVAGLFVLGLLLMWIRLATGRVYAGLLRRRQVKEKKTPHAESADSGVVAGKPKEVEAPHPDW